MAAPRTPNKPDFKITMPPPELAARAEVQTPTTPTTFTSPTQTPQGSPSKKQLPPGAHDLPSAFENAMKLVPTAGNPNKATIQQFQPSSPSKTRQPPADDTINDFRASVIQTESYGRGNKENTPPGPPSAKPSPHLNQAAVSRHELYRQKDQLGSGTRPAASGLSPDIIEKLQKPNVRRMANVTQLCKQEHTK